MHSNLNSPSHLKGKVSSISTVFFLKEYVNMSDYSRKDIGGSNMIARLRVLERRWQSAVCRQSLSQTLPFPPSLQLLSFFFFFFGCVGSSLLCLAFL